MTKSIAINKEQHANLKVATQRNLTHIANQNLTTITAKEYGIAANNFPIFLIKQPEETRFRSIVMFGLEEGENLFCTGDLWNATYAPQSISMTPFSLGLDPEKEKSLTTFIDIESEYVGEDKDNALFDTEGNETDYHKNIQKSLSDMYENEVMTELFINELSDNKLLQPIEIHLTYNTGKKRSLVGIYGINEKALSELSAEKLTSFHKRGMLLPIYAMISSSAQINRLVQLRNLSVAEIKIQSIQVSLVPVATTEEAAND